MFVFLKVVVPYISGTIMDVEYFDYDNYTADIDSNLTTEGTLNLYSASSSSTYALVAVNIII